MATGKQLVELAKKHVGEKYVLGIIAPKDDPYYKGPFDCAEFTSYIVYQLTGKLYGCANNNTTKLSSADAYSGFWGRDANVLGIKVSVNEGSQIIGAVLVRLAGNGLIGHVAFVQPDLKTVEANSTKYGLIESKISGRRWDFAVKIPWVDYSDSVITIPDINNKNKKPDGKIYRLADPLMYDEFIKKIQKALGFSLSSVDGWYGSKTYNAVRAFQIKKGLVPDGEVGPKTLKLLNI